MGIRIHKALGYGLTNVLFSNEHHNAGCIDPRIRPGIFSDQDFDKKINDYDAFMIFLRTRTKDCAKVLAKVNKKPHKNLTDEEWEEHCASDILVSTMVEKPKFHHPFFVYNPDEVDDLRVNYIVPLLFIPIEKPDFYRYDDPIDYEEQRAVSEGKIKVLEDSCGIYPYIGVSHIPHAPRYGEEGYPDKMECSQYNQLVGRWSQSQPPILEGEILEYYKKYYRPAIHPSVIICACWLDLFVDFYKTIHELRPIIYTWWG